MRKEKRQFFVGEWMLLARIIIFFLIQYVSTNHSVYSRSQVMSRTSTIRLFSGKERLHSLPTILK